MYNEIILRVVRAVLGRSLQPTGVILEVSLSVSFHPEFTTADDRIFNMQCFHQKKSNGSSLSLSIGSPQPPPSDSKGPSCSYEVLAYPGGPPAGRLALGQNVYHSWKCQNVYVSDKFACDKTFSLCFQTSCIMTSLQIALCLFAWSRTNKWAEFRVLMSCRNSIENTIIPQYRPFVQESCIMIDSCELIGGEQKHQVIDSSGCSKHDSIMPQLEYHNRTNVGAQVKVFGVSHSPIVYFACQVRLHPQLPSGDCPKPNCSSNVVETRRKREDSSQFPSIDVRSQNLEISQLINATSPEAVKPTQEVIPTCPEIHVESSETSGEEASASKQSEEERICADFQSVLIVSILLTVALILITTAIVILIVRRQKYEIASMS
uniref:ZP domain-containing protein n=1 Tax=Caenorhabditis japonica TaxID=281687 RepID=A0A8R1HW74_CAEJA